MKSMNNDDFNVPKNPPGTILSDEALSEVSGGEYSISVSAICIDGIMYSRVDFQKAKECLSFLALDGQAGNRVCNNCKWHVDASTSTGELAAAAMDTYRKYCRLLCPKPFL